MRTSVDLEGQRLADELLRLAAADSELPARGGQTLTLYTRYGPQQLLVNMVLDNRKLRQWNGNRVYPCPAALTRSTLLRT